MIENRKVALYEEFARVGKALSSPLRLVLLDVLAQGERNVEDLAITVGAKLANTSAQLQVLRSAGLVASRRDGNRIWYGLTDDDTGDLVDRLRAVAHHNLADADRAARSYLGEFVETIAPDELNRRIRNRTVIVIDVRPHIEYDAGHLPEAVSIPLDQIETRLSELPAGTDIVAYCRGPFCVLAPEAARILTRYGHRAHSLTTGYPQWRRAGLPIEPAQVPAAKP